MGSIYKIEPAKGVKFFFVTPGALVAKKVAVCLI